ncbi:MAG: hypothetical protein HY720_04730 [Planctomycetes bacterium]|nr:hypothetical protein [Planctomycetota bacterium]
MRLEFEVLERLKRRARREHRRTPAECIEIASQLSELFPASNRVVQRFEFDEGEGRRML